MANKRRSSRVVVDIDASFIIPSDPQSYHKSTLVNISKSGLGMTCSDDIPVGSQLQILMFPDLHNKILLNVRAVWSKKNGKKKSYQIGLEIFRADSPNVDRFLDFYSKELSKQEAVKK